MFFWTLLGALVLLVLRELATLLAVLVGWMAEDGDATRHKRSPGDTSAAGKGT